VPHRVRRQAHSLKRDIGQASQQRQANSPMSMTSPMTTLFLGQYAPLLFRSSVAPHSTLPHSESGVFLRRDLRHRADYYAIQALLAERDGEQRVYVVTEETPAEYHWVHDRWPRLRKVICSIQI
jgi:hypothetical protein